MSINHISCEGEKNMKKHIITTLLALLTTGCKAGEVNPPLRITEIDLIPVSCLASGPQTATVTIFVDGGTPPYMFSKDGGATFQSSNEFTGLIAGDYAFEIKDASGTTPLGAAISIEQSAFETLTITQAPDCEDRFNMAIITVNSTGGTSPSHTLQNESAQTIEGNNVQFDPIAAGDINLVSTTASCNPIGIAFDLIIPQASGNAIEDFINTKYCIPCTTPS